MSPVNPRRSVTLGNKAFWVHRCEHGCFESAFTARPLSLSSILLQLEPKPAGSTGEFLIDSEILYEASYESAVTDMY